MKLRRIRSRPTPKGKLRGIRSRPTPEGEIQGDQDQTPSPTTTTAVGGTHPTGMHSCSFILANDLHIVWGAMKPVVLLAIYNVTKL